MGAVSFKTMLASSKELVAHKLEVGMWLARYGNVHKISEPRKHVPILRQRSGRDNGE